MKLFRLSTLSAITGAVAAGALLFWTSQSVQQAEDRLARLEQGVKSEQQAIRVLHAEWDYLNSPARLEQLAAQYLNAEPVSVFKVSEDVSDLPDALPVPSLTAQPVALRMTSGGIPVPGTKPPHKSGQSFRAMLNDVRTEDAP